MIDFLKSFFSFREQKKQLLRLILIAFLASFVVARLYSLYIGHSVYFRGYHIHHFYFGTLALSIGGVIGILAQDKNYLRFASLLMGFGMGLFTDEIGLLLNCTTNNRTCVYAFPDTGDIISSIVVVFLLLFVLVDFTEKRFNSKNGGNGSNKIDSSKRPDV